MIHAVNKLLKQEFLKVNFSMLFIKKKLENQIRDSSIVFQKKFRYIEERSKNNNTSNENKSIQN